MTMAFQQGYNAYLDGEAIWENPYEEYTSDYDDWKNGWHESKLDNMNRAAVQAVR